MKIKHVDSGRKVEPMSKAVNPSYVAEMGNKIGNHSMENGTIRVKHETMYEGKGYKAPMAGGSNHGNRGTQGRH